MHSASVIKALEERGIPTDILKSRGVGKRDKSDKYASLIYKVCENKPAILSKLPNILLITWLNA